MARVIVPAAEALLDQDLPIYGGQGFVRLVDYMGGDARIVQAARVSYGAGTKTIREDRGLIRHLVSHLHTSPLEKVRFEFLVAGVPLPIATQWIRHRMASPNFVSYRYSEVPDDAQFRLAPEDIRAQSATNKQVGEGQAVSEAATAFVAGIGQVQALAKGVYDQAIAGGVAREQARLVMPQTTTTSFYWTIDLHNVLHFLRLRLAPDAQAEIREPSERIAECVRAVCPIAFEAFEDFILNATKFSAPEMAAMRRMLQGKPTGLDEKARVRLEAKLFGPLGEVTA